MKITRRRPGNGDLPPAGGANPPASSAPRTGWAGLRKWIAGALALAVLFAAGRQLYIDYDPMQSWAVARLYFTPVSKYTPKDVILMVENLAQPPQWAGLKARLGASLQAPQLQANALANYPDAYKRDINRGYHLLTPPVITFRSVKQLSTTEVVVTYQTVATADDTNSGYRAVRETTVQAVTLVHTADGWKALSGKLLSDHTAWAH